MGWDGQTNGVLSSPGRLEVGNAPDCHWCQGVGVLVSWFSAQCWSVGELCSRRKEPRFPLALFQSRHRLSQPGPSEVRKGDSFAL